MESINENRIVREKEVWFVTGACSKSLCNEKLREQWEMCDAIVQSWLMSSINEELLSGIVYAISAFDVWGDLRE